MMMKKKTTLFALAALIGVATVMPTAGFAQDWPALRSVQSNSMTLKRFGESPSDALRRTYRSFSLTQSMTSNVCSIQGGFRCAVKTPQPVDSACACGSARGTIVAESDLCQTASGLVCRAPFATLGSACSCGSDSGTIQPRR